MQEPPKEIQEEIRQEWAEQQYVDVERLRALYPEWQEEIEDFILGVIIDSDEIPEELEDLVFELMEGGRKRRRRPRRPRVRGPRLME